MHHPTTELRARKDLVVWTLLACLVLYSGLHFARLPAYLSEPRNHYLDGLLLTTPDGYYYLRQAAEVSMGLYSSQDSARAEVRSALPPLLSLVAVGLHHIPGVSLMNAAFFIPPALAFGLVLSAGLVGWAIRRPCLGLLGGLAASASYLWYTRVFVGAFDTDCLILPLVLGAQGCLLIAEIGPARRPLAWVLAALAQLGLLYLWWGYGGLALAGLVLGAWVVTGALPGSGRLRKTKLAFLASGLGLAAFILLGYFRVFPSELVESFRHHLDLIFKTQDSIFAETGGTVAELSLASALEIATDTSGHWAIFMAVACGFGLLAYRHPRAGFIVGAPCITLGIVALWAGNRFSMFLAPMHGLGLAWLCADLFAPYVTRRGMRYGLPAALAAGLALAAPATWACISAPIAPAHDYNAVELASVINRKSPADAFVWNWWGPGYMHEYFTRRECLMDGGKQQPGPVFVSAVPFATNDPALARNWIKFFSVNHNGIDMLSGIAGGTGKAAAFLKEALADPTRLDEILDRYAMPHDRDWRALLFPQRDVYLILHAEMLLRSTWNSLGRWDPIQRKGPDIEIFLMPLDNLSVDRSQGILRNTAGETLAYSRLYFVSPTSLDHDEARDKGSVAIRIAGLPFLYTLDQESFDCLAYRLLFVHPETTPGFKAIFYNPFIGGVWQVL